MSCRPGVRPILGRTHPVFVHRGAQSNGSPGFCGGRCLASSRGRPHRGEPPRGLRSAPVRRWSGSSLFPFVRHCTLCKHGCKHPRAALQTIFPKFMQRFPTGMPPPRRKQPVNARLAALMEDALARSDKTIEELAKDSGLGRGTIGRIVRGEIQRPAPEQANRIVPHLRITMADFLEACGYHVSLSAQQRVPDDLAEAWGKLDRPTQDSLRQLALAQARRASSGGGSEA